MPNFSKLSIKGATILSKAGDTNKISKKSDTDDNLLDDIVPFVHFPHPDAFDKNHNVTQY